MTPARPGTNEAKNGEGQGGVVLGGFLGGLLGVSSCSIMVFFFFFLIYIFFF